MSSGYAELLAMTQTMNTFSFQRIWGMVLRQWYELRRSPDRVVDSFFWPTLDIIVWGLLTFFVDSFSPTPIVGAILGGIIFWSFTYSVSRDITMTSIQDLWDRNLYNVIASPLRPIELMVAASLYALIRLVVLFLLLAGLSALLYHFSFFIFLPFMLPAIITLIIFGAAFGILMSGAVYRYGSNAQILCWSGIAVLMPFLGVMYPIALLPSSLHFISWMSPPTYVFEAVRAFIGSGVVPSLATWIVPSLLNVLYLTLATWYFFHAFRHAKRRGWFVKMD